MTDSVILLFSAIFCAADGVIAH